MTGVEWPRRRALRLPGYDYTRAGAYFVTICTRYRESLLGRVVDGESVLSPFGAIADATWRWLGEQYPYVVIDTYVIMSNHLHGILWIVDEPGDGANPDGGSFVPAGGDEGEPSMADDGGRSRTPPMPTAPTRPATTTPPTTAPKRKPLGRLIGAFKTVSTKEINLLRGTPGAVFWQRNYYEHIIRDERALETIRLYIQRNPARWPYDTQNPQRLRRPGG